MGYVYYGWSNDFSLVNMYLFKVGTGNVYSGWSNYFSLVNMYLFKVGTGFTLVGVMISV